MTPTIGPAVLVMDGETWHTCPECDGLGVLPTVLPSGLPANDPCPWCLDFPTSRDGRLVPHSLALAWQRLREVTA